MNPIEEKTELEKIQDLEDILKEIDSSDPWGEYQKLLLTGVAELYRTRYELNCYHEGKIAAAKVDKGKGI